MPIKEVVVIDGDPAHNWVEIFEGCTLSDGSTLHIIQASWLECAVTNYLGDSGCMMLIAPVRESDGNVVRPETMGVKPDFVIVRNQPRGPTPGSDKRNVLFGLMSAGIPAINSFHSMYMCLERPIMFGALREIEKRLGHAKFPLIKQNFYSNYTQMVISPDLPCILKVSHAHAGMGKMRLNDMTEFKDLSTILALYNDYCTAEPYVNAEYGIRVQKIGNHYRIMKKIFTGSGWKSQFGGASLEEVPLTEEYKRWADECSKCFGGMDIFAIDALHGLDGKDYIIELNDTAIGILSERWLEDSMRIRDLSLDRMDDIFCKDIGEVVPLKDYEAASVSKAYKGDRPPLKQKEEVRRRREPAEESFVNLKTILLVLMVVVVLISCVVANMYMLK